KKAPFGGSRGTPPLAPGGPGYDLGPRRFGILRVIRWHDSIRRIQGDERERRWPDNVDPRLLVPRELGEARKIRRHVGVVEIHGLLAECRLVRDPIQDVVLIEGLREYARG